MNTFKNIATLIAFFLFIAGALWTMAPPSTSAQNQQTELLSGEQATLSEDEAALYSFASEFGVSSSDVEFTAPFVQYVSEYSGNLEQDAKLFCSLMANDAVNRVNQIILSQIDFESNVGLIPAYTPLKIDDVKFVITDSMAETLRETSAEQHGTYLDGTKTVDGKPLSDSYVNANLGASTYINSGTIVLNASFHAHEGDLISYWLYNTMCHELIHLALISHIRDSKNFEFALLASSCHEALAHRFADLITSDVFSVSLTEIESWGSVPDVCEVVSYELEDEPTALTYDVSREFVTAAVCVEPTLVYAAATSPEGNMIMAEIAVERHLSETFEH